MDGHLNYRIKNISALFNAVRDILGLYPFSPYTKDDKLEIILPLTGIKEESYFVNDSGELIGIYNLDGRCRKIYFKEEFYKSRRYEFHEILRLLY